MLRGEETVRGRRPCRGMVDTLSSSNKQFKSGALFRDFVNGTSPGRCAGMK